MIYDLTSNAYCDAYNLQTHVNQVQSNGKNKAHINSLFLSL